MKKIYALCLLVVSFVSAVYAQPGTPDLSFNSGGAGANGPVNVIAVQSDGKILIGGTFTTYNGATANKLARLNADGTLDNTFVTGIGVNPGAGSVDAIVIQPDDKVLIAGYITNYNGTSVNMMCRLNADGTLDNSFNSSVTNPIKAMALQADGKVIIGGVFTSIGGTMGVNRIARLNANGTHDNTFNTGTGCNASVETVAIQEDGKVLVGGGFTGFNGTSVSGMVRLNTNGTFDSALATANGYVKCIKTQGTGVNEKIIVCGEFSMIGGLNVGRIVRLNMNGTVEGSFYSNTGSGAGQNVEEFAYDATSGDISIAGSLYTFNGTTIPTGVTRLSQDGVREVAFNSGNTGANSDIKAIAVQSDGKIIIGGNFDAYNGTNFGYITRLNSQCIVAIPDANFKAYLVGNASINTNMDTEISCAEASAYNGTINVPNLSIADLTGIEAFTNVQQIFCNGNQLTSLNLSGNTGLVNVNCSNNQLTSFSTGNSPNYNTVNCMNNQLTSLNFSANTSLAWLNASNNPLTSLNLGSNTNLSSLQVYNTLLNSLNLSALTGLTYLDCSTTPISSLDVSMLANLTGIVCVSIQATSIDLSNNPLLTDIYVYNNQLTSLNIANGNNANINYFWVHNNPNLTCIKVDDAAYSNANWISGTQVNEDPFIYDNTVVFDNVCLGAGVEENTNEFLEVYPNPADDQITVFMSQKGIMGIYSMSGAKIAAFEMIEGENTIDLTDLEKGMYFLTLSNGQTTKIIKK